MQNEKQRLQKIAGLLKENIQEEETSGKVYTIHFSDYIPEKNSRYYSKNSVISLAKKTNVKISDFIEKNVNNNMEFLVSGTKPELLKFMQIIFDAPDYSIEDLDYAIDDDLNGSDN
jgi:hypothetical protein